MEGFNVAVLVTIGIFAITHLGVAIWFASKMNIKVTDITSAVKEMADDLKEFAVVNTRLTVLEQRMNRTEDDMREVLKAAALLGHKG